MSTSGNGGSPPASAFREHRSILTAAQLATAEAQFRILSPHLPSVEPNKPLTRGVWVSGFRREPAPAKELLFWTDLALTCLLSARTALRGGGELLPTDDVADFLSAALEDVDTSDWEGAPEGMRRALFVFAFADAVGQTDAAAKAGLDEGQVALVRACRDSIRICRKESNARVGRDVVVRMEKVRMCDECEVYSADLVKGICEGGYVGIGSAEEKDLPIG